jgi:hypothetical protein
MAFSYGVLNEYHLWFVFITQAAWMYPGVLIFISIGAMAHCFLREEKLKLSQPTFIGLSILAAIMSLLASINHLNSHQHLEDTLFIGIMFSWVFVFGFVLGDPPIRQMLQRLDKFLQLVDSRILEILASIRSAIYKAFRNILVSDRSLVPDPHPVPARSESGDMVIAPVSSSRGMQLKLKRSQRSSLTGKVLFVLDARMEIPPEEYNLIQKYRLGNELIYDSSARQEHEKAMKEHLERSKNEHAGYRGSAGEQLWGVGKTFYRIARAGVSATRASLSLRITVHSLMRGVHIECKSMAELLTAENAIAKAGETLRWYLNEAATFDGREEVHEF